MLSVGILFIIGAAVLLSPLLIAMLFRRVVDTNEVHIVQSAKKTLSYGKGTENGNTYYEWPSWLPVVGISKSVFPVSVFDLDLESYEAYDLGRLPFVIDVKAFFRITDSNLAAQRVASFRELNEQLLAIVQGAVRTILASSDIEKIMQGRSEFGDQFTKEVKEQLVEWGVSTVKNIELMDIRDAHDSDVIHNIMEKKKSHIEMESRTEVANNNKLAKTAEIEANKEVEVKKQIAEEAIGLREAATTQSVSIANEQADQAVKEQQRETKEREMKVLEVERVRSAEITKDVALLKASETKETAVIEAEGRKQTEVIVAAGELAAELNEAEGVQALGLAKAEAEKALQLAPVTAQITLAKEIGGNKEYQTYLVTVEKIKAAEKVGVEQAKALAKADIKVLSNAGDPAGGLTKAMDLFSPAGGVKVGQMLDAFTQTETGAKVMAALGGEEPSKENPPEPSH